MFPFSILTISWDDIYRFIVAFLVIGVVVLAFFLAKSMFNGSKQYTGFMKAVFGFINVDGPLFVMLAKVLYITITAYYVLTVPLCFTAGFFSGFFSMIRLIVFDIGGTRLVFEALMLLYRTHAQIAARNAADGVSVSEVSKASAAPAVAPAAPVAAVPAPVPVAAAPVPEPAAPAPIPEPAAPAPIPEPVAPAPIPEPAAPAPIPEPVAPAPIPEPVAPAPIPEPAAPAPIPEPAASAPASTEAPQTKSCVSCGKDIKAAARFCPFCGSAQQ